MTSIGSATSQNSPILVHNTGKHKKDQLDWYFDPNTGDIIGKDKNEDIIKTINPLNALEDGFRKDWECGGGCSAEHGYIQSEFYSLNKGEYDYVTVWGHDENKDGVIDKTEITYNFLGRRKEKGDHIVKDYDEQSLEITSDVYLYRDPDIKKL